jgi:predicted dehydrogenase
MKYVFYIQKKLLTLLTIKFRISIAACFIQRALFVSSKERVVLKKINLAIIGCGSVANSHLKAWKRLHNAEVVAVSDLNETSAKNTASLWNIPHYFGSLSQLIENLSVDLVDICTPPQSHASLAVQAMEKGLHVLLEKPMTMTTKDADKIVACQRASGMKVGVMHNELFEPPVLKASSFVGKGHLGDIISVEVETLCTKWDSMAANEHHWCHSLPGGRFSEMLAHPIYLLSHFLGKVEVEHVDVSKYGEYSWMRSDELCAIFRAGNKLGRVYATFNAPHDAIFISLYGTEGILKLDIVNATVVFTPRRVTSRFNKGLDSLRQAGQLLRSTTEDVVKIASKRWECGHELCIRLFAQSLETNSDPPFTVKDGYEVVKMLEVLCDKIELAEKDLGAKSRAL